MDNITFEQAMKRLEEIIKELEDNQTSLENKLPTIYCVGDSTPIIKHC